MKLVTAQRADDLLSRIKTRFADFNKASQPRKGRKYPDELMAMVRQAIREGAAAPALCQITGVSSSAMSRWARAAEVEAAPARRPERAVRPPRRLDVVGQGTPKAVPAKGPVVVRLPSGVTIDFADGSALDSGLLAALAALEVSHAASR